MVWLDLELNPGLPDHWRTLYPLGQLCYQKKWFLGFNIAASTWHGEHNAFAIKTFFSQSTPTHNWWYPVSGWLKWSIPSRLIPKDSCPVSWGSRIHWLHLCRGVRPPLTSVLDMTLNNLMVRFQQCWSFGECGVPLHCHRSQVHSGLER